MLSVVVPCRNRQNLIVNTINSLAGIRRFPVEILVVDDHSTDSSVAVAQEAIRRVSAAPGFSGRVVPGPGRGACAARNAGLSAATGEWVLFLDSDDPCEGHGVEQLCGILAKDEVADVAYGWVWEVDESGKKLHKNGVALEDCANYVFDHHWHTSGPVYRKSLLDRAGGWDEALTLADDWEFGARARMHARKIKYADVCVGSYVHHAGERLIARKFERRKATSVIRAALKIRANARKLGLLDSHLRQRVWRRLLVQANELLLHGEIPPSNRVLTACTRQKDDRFVALIAAALLAVPVRSFRASIYSRLRAKGIRG
jgi:glycosyltransferase involved in cell wall biosynthesis